MSSSSSAMDIDQDGDGWTPAQGDCCDVPGPNCANPELVNPGAFEYPGNNVDDDCDPSTPDNMPPPTCSTQANFQATTSDQLIQAMDLCQTTTENPPLDMKKWGVISTELLLADGSNAVLPKDVQTGVMTQYGPNVLPQKGMTMASISSGSARAPGDPGYVHPQNGKNFNQVGNLNAGTQCGAPPTYLQAHGGVLPPPVNCPKCNGPMCSESFDSVNLKARIRVPTNAKSFSYDFKFYSAEFPEYLCQQYNDFFVTLLKSQAANLPADGDIAFDANKNPVSVNNAFFDVCEISPGVPPGSCSSGQLELVGTGMGGWGNDLTDGGGTQWLTNDAPIVPGETIEIQFIIWDAGDHNVDSLILLDKFRWNLTPSAVGVHK